MTISMEVNEHLANWENETKVTPHESDWFKWIDKVEEINGYVDGNIDEDGYSIDSFYVMWEKGWSVMQAVTATREDHQAMLDE